MFISIIVPTYNRGNLLSITLKSLINQNYPKDLFEILVVDNNSSDHTANVVKEIELIANCNIRYFFESRQGSHFARNCVVKYSKGEILYFTDDDMIADPNVLKEIVALFNKHPQLATITGSVLPKWEIDPPKWVKKYCINGWLSLFDREEDIFISKNDFGVFSCHQAILKDIFVKSGGYNPDIVDGEWLGDNETGLNIKIKKLGYQFGFTKKAITYHMIPTYRMTQKYLNKRFANQGNCDSYTDFREKIFTKQQLLDNIKSHRKKMAILFFKFLCNLFLIKDKWRIHLAKIYYFQNRIHYDKRLIYDKKWREMVLINDWINI